MPSAESVSHEDLILCASGEKEYKTRDIIDAALWRGDLENPWNQFLRRLEAEKQADESELDMDDDAIDSAAEAFRYERDLITAEETEQWLAARSLTLDDFSDYFSRQYWGTKLEGEVSGTDTPYPAASDDVRRVFAAEVILSGDLDWLTTELIWRLAAARAEGEPDATSMATEEQEFFERHGIQPAELGKWLDQLGRDAAWFAEIQATEAAYRKRCQAILQPQAFKNELASLRLPLTRFETEVIGLESRDAAQEATFCVTEDGMSMEEVAEESRYPYRRVNFLLEDLPPDLQQLFMSVSPGELIDPMPRGDGFELCRVTAKIEPNTEDPAVKQKIQDRLLEKHFTELSSKYVERRLGAVVSAE